MQRVWKAVEILALSLWVGAMVGFGALMAPELFAVVPSRSLAGEVAGRAIARIDIAGVVLGILAMVAVIVSSRRRPGRLWRVIPLLVMLGLTVTNLTVVRDRLDAVEERMDNRPIEEFAETDPLRLEYNRWHQISVNLWGANMLLGAAALIWAGVEGEAPTGRTGGPNLVRPGKW